ncbi:MAG: pantetheine-phosphate adenylyltransferase [Candidatus Woesearchaeota archaeon]|jgi:pantetheine-phosphate adenylyltransferase|nr:pantetheine-phosphate adenylyltransferase [Candidatus Woesearchaeota archaeon]MDP7622784.1 pantetheine-phosphate adenylyltransferase [Candidatus Woesearchaeota archaeon]HJN56483.1 pantetheine-phosphate adenylyltransferase [Candidatus Woesearchaeota archaeon]|tara:strand:+ start:19308 stop:19790 length:483 start_codon:yes stop_codon:yes gene_type:complete
MKTAVYPGSFDPVTNGHIDVIKRALKIFDKIIITVGDNPGKKPAFSIEERLEMLRECTKDMGNAEIDTFSGLLIDYVRKKGSRIIIRGLRAVSDFDFEFQRALMNRVVDDEIETIFIMTKEHYVYLNSSIVKEMAMFNGDINGLVPEIVEKKLKEKFSKN